MGLERPLRHTSRQTTDRLRALRPALRQDQKRNVRSRQGTHTGVRRGPPNPGTALTGPVAHPTPKPTLATGEPPSDRTHSPMRGDPQQNRSTTTQSQASRPYQPVHFSPTNSFAHPTRTRRSRTYPSGRPPIQDAIRPMMNTPQFPCTSTTFNNRQSQVASPSRTPHPNLLTDRQAKRTRPTLS